MIDDVLGGAELCQHSHGGNRCIWLRSYDFSRQGSIAADFELFHIHMLGEIMALDMHNFATHSGQHENVI